MTDKPSGSFVLWQNTLCNPLADPISMTHSAWHDGYASAKAERKPLTDAEIGSIEMRLRKYIDGDRYDLSLSEFARAIERAHGIGGEA